MTYALEAMGKIRPKSKRARGIDPRVDALLGEIEAAARAQGMTLLQLSEATGRKHTSTWDGWRSGQRAPKFSDLADFAAVLGLRVGRMLDGPPWGQQGGFHVASDDATNIALLVDRLDKADRKELLKLVLNFVKTHVSGSHPPPAGGGEAPTDRRE